VLTQTAPATVAQLCADATTRAWSVLAEGETVATTRGTCLGLEERGWHLVSEVSDPAGSRPDYELHLWLDDEAHPLSAQMRTGIATAHYRWTPDSLTASLYGDAHTLVFDRPRHDVWVLPSHALYLRESMLRLGVGMVDEGILQLGFVPEVGEVVPLPLTPDADGDLVVGDAARFVMAPDTTGLADAQVLEVLTGQQAAYRRAAADQPFESQLPETPRPTYTPGEGLRIEPVLIPSPRPGEPALAGELVRAAEMDTSTPHPGVVFISGSGPQDRYGFVPGTSIDTGSHEIHDALARAGFVVLRVDDRGVGESERGHDVTPGFRAQVDDARRAVDALAARPEIDPRRIVVIGHGEGALVASIVSGERRKHVAATVLLSAAARNARELIYWSLRESMRDEDPQRVEAAVAHARKLHEAAIADTDLPAASEPMREWMVEIFAEDPLARLKRLRTPVLALAGAKDFQTDANLDFGPIAALVEKRSRDGSASRLFPGLDHLLKPEPGVSTVGHYSDLTRRVDPEVLAHLSAWCQARVGAPNPG
jgi:pimeloyl-ACP methyl ester carboxylesterase